MNVRGIPIKKYVIGLDYGTNSCRAVLMKINSERELAVGVFNYPSGDAGVLGDISNPHVARQNPQDYIDGMLDVIKQVLRQGREKIEGFEAAQVVSVGFATTGSTVIPVDDCSIPLAFHSEFKNNLNAYAWLWKDHTSDIEAEKITAVAAQNRPEYLDACGGTYSSEWFWAKIWHLKNIDENVFNAAFSYVELCDFLPAVLSGNSDPKTIRRSICAAGHKALYADKWGGLPDVEFLAQCDLDLAKIRENLFEKAYASDQLAGELDAAWAEKTGLSLGTKLAVGAFDAHLGAVGAGIAEGKLVKIMGTSTCDLLVTQSEQNIKGVCGQVMDSVVPGYIGIEAGQSAVGDIFLWLVNNLTPESYGNSNSEKFASLTREAAKLVAGQSGLLALDWNNGNRSVLVDMNLSGLILGQTLHSKAHEIYRALIEATAFGAKKIIDRLAEADVKVDEVICCGGLANKNALMMQIYADVIGCKIRIAGTEQTCAVGAAISAASVIGDQDMLSLQKAMTPVGGTVYEPQPYSQSVYKQLYALYEELHDSFGEESFSVNHYHLMKSLSRIRTDSVKNLAAKDDNLQSIASPENAESLNDIKRTENA